MRVFRTISILSRLICRILIAYNSNYYDIRHRGWRAHFQAKIEKETPLAWNVASGKPLNLKRINKSPTIEKNSELSTSIAQWRHGAHGGDVIEIKSSFIFQRPCFNWQNPCATGLDMCEMSRKHLSQPLSDDEITKRRPSQASYRGKAYGDAIR